MSPVHLSIVCLVLCAAAALAQPAGPGVGAGGDGGVGLDGGSAPDAGAPPRPLEVRTTVSPQAVKLGEPFEYRIELRHRSAERYELGTPPDAALEDFEVLDRDRARADGPDTSVTTFRLKLSAFALGELALPELPVEVRTAAGFDVFTVPGPKLQVLSTLGPDAGTEGADLVDIQPPREVPVPSYTLLWALLAAIAVGLLAFFGLRAWKRRKARAELVPPHPLDSRTRAALEALAREELPAQGRVREYFFRLSEIVRAYLGERYGFDALECTSAELMVQVRKLPAPGLPKDELGRFVYDADLAKFARAPISPETCAAWLQFARDLVDRTTLPPTPTPQDPHAPDAHAR